MRARPDRSLGSVLQPEVNGLYVHLHRRFGDHQRDLKKEPRAKYHLKLRIPPL